MMQTAKQVPVKYVAGGRLKSLFATNTSSYGIFIIYKIALHNYVFLQTLKKKRSEKFICKCHQADIWNPPTANLYVQN